MEEYIDELANNSDDEKRLFRAESRAGRKLKANKAKAKKQVSNRGRGVCWVSGERGFLSHQSAEFFLAKAPCSSL